MQSLNNNLCWRRIHYCSHTILIISMPFKIHIFHLRIWHSKKKKRILSLRNLTLTLEAVLRNTVTTNKHYLDRLWTSKEQRKNKMISNYFCQHRNWKYLLLLRIRIQSKLKNHHRHRILNKQSNMILKLQRLMIIYARRLRTCEVTMQCLP